ncbi:guanylate kinase [Kipferlia bialata]|uniref:guanylate kinase n=1 Tax=Kipferlia bialata TaxID=797122 RepID=A0A9K3CQN2_9EUKA|nr:guanylate kinase [Kipferlia bialata]|eukprot:g1460.t1
MMGHHEKNASCSRIGEPSLIILNGPSGVGKSTLLRRLLSEYHDQFGFSVSHTTRGPRNYEVHGEHYYFVSDEKFNEIVEAGDMIEHANVHGCSYGTSSAAVHKVLDTGRSCILDLDNQGACSIKEWLARHPNPPRAHFIVILPPSLEDLEFRLRSRGSETEATFITRIENAREELDWYAAHPGFYDSYIVNSNVASAYRAFCEATEVCI